MKHFFVMIAWVILLPSCGNNAKRMHDRRTNKKVKTTKVDSYIAKKIQKKDPVTLDFIRLQEAKMSDIPVPLSSQPITDYFDPAGASIMLGYKDKLLSMADVRDFYIREMERLGWQIEEQFIGYESQLRFTKPDRSCLISIRFDVKKEKVKFVICSGAISEFVA